MFSDVIMMIEKVLEISMLYDFYGELLTDKQKDVIELYYNDDLSLGEISETLGISRQGVYDMIKRSEKQLHRYEERLGLVGKFNMQKSKVVEAYKLLQDIDDDGNLQKIKSLLGEIIEANI